MFKLTKENLLPHDEKTIKSLERKRDRLIGKLVEVQVELIMKEYENETGFRAPDIECVICDTGEQILDEFVNDELSEQIKSDIEDIEKEALKANKVA
jgi:hypothetical protein